MSILNKLISDPYNVANNMSVKELEELILEANDKYYNTSKPIISDNIYDLLIDFLKYKFPKSKVLKEIGAKLRTKNKVKLDYHLGSMDKIKPSTNKLQEWKKEFKGPYILTDKLDGISALIIYRNNDTINLYTRGTSTEGLNITGLLKYIGVPSIEKVKKYMQNKKKGTKNLIALRGELILSKEVFEERWKDKLKNARNAVSGLVNSKTINPEIARDTDFVIYEVVDPNTGLDGQLKIARDLGFTTVNFKIKQDIDYEYLSKYLKKRRKKSSHKIDGIVVSNLDKHRRNTSGNPKYSFAFKDDLDDQKAKTTIKKIVWNVSKDGYINPTVVIKPVEIDGVKISRITAYNAKYVIDNKLGKGAKIELIRSGDVIPKIISVLKPAEKVELPKSDWEFTPSKVDIKLKSNKNNDKINIKNIYFFFSTLNAKGLGEKIVEKIYYDGNKTIIDFIKLKKKDLLEIEGFKEKSSENIVNSIKESLKDVELARLISASNKLGHGMGYERAKMVLKKYPNLLKDYKKWSKKEFIDKIKEISGWEEKTSQQFVNNFKDFINFYEKIKPFISIKKIDNSIKSSKLNDNKIVLSGFRDKQLEQELEKVGAKVVTAISSKINYLVVKDKTISSSKVEKAKKLNIKIITKKELEQKL
jgi:NAD-dependent DNA ligase